MGTICLSQSHADVAGPLAGSILATLVACYLLLPRAEPTQAKARVPRDGSESRIGGVQLRA